MRHLGGFTRQLLSFKTLLATVGGSAGLGLALRLFMKTGDELALR
jgi:hypothetical protein